MGIEGGGAVGGKQYSEKECFEEALKNDPKYVKAWLYLGLFGGGAVDGGADDGAASPDIQIDFDEHSMWLDELEEEFELSPQKAMRGGVNGALEG